MANPLLVVFVHGWSVTSTDTYGGLPARLKREASAAGGPDLDVRNIYLGQYVSFRDEVRLEDVRLIVPHQANARIIEAAAKRLGVGPDVMVNNIANYGNTSTASIPLALKDAVGAGRLERGDHLVLVGFGSGLTWGACVIEWEGAPVRVAA